MFVFDRKGLARNVKHRKDDGSSLSAIATLSRAVRLLILLKIRNRGIFVD